ncbi:hypothetical protein CLAFUW4_14272 [Fulvia fulva]|uniref:Secreted protein n=1 Tax=Passalora fulva TaxID=5499 RepID=A0A9Q8PM07_PASFU|nr:uncharacterized protein CLAFUR5_14105 [Fulvia fulva]KAK4609031.1 hypothetical protein CLAFUR4_14272 [Fulvia fulva]KAK4610030.1 hypothetical protein CLAFUR0_14276 [Fulvia fulva]UJO25005.1 hypothetical protein CLAFUR5_14105 [Fulvia fulva]WPV22653.1 hypothetical protein CLAFUW4_14272 [Fulvia fulva]WPV37424.1 hypothetical protein CLAFUW7_14280 [Fulvia fulva]
MKQSLPLLLALATAVMSSLAPRPVEPERPARTESTASALDLPEAYPTFSTYRGYGKYGGYGDYLPPPPDREGAEVKVAKRDVEMNHDCEEDSD